MNRERSAILAGLIILLSANIVYTQTYSLSPGDSVVETVPFNDLYHFNILQNNLTDHFINFSWSKISSSVPAGWQAFLCDNGFCFDDLPDSGSMDTVFTGDVGLMSIGINAFDIEGVATIQYAVWDQLIPEDMDTLTWIITAQPFSLISQNNMQNISLYPNPANASLYVETSQEISFAWEITDLMGGIIMNGNSVKSSAIISTQSIPVGVYFISVSLQGNNKLVKQLEIVH